MAGQRTGTTVTAIRGGAVTLAEAADAFLSSPRVGQPQHAPRLRRRARPPGRRARPGRQLAAVPGDEIAAALRRLWGEAPRRRGTATGPPSCPG